MEKNDIITVTCEALGTQGEGIARADGVTFFVPRFLPGERASVRVLKCKGNIAYAKIEELLTPAEERVRPACPVFGRCGGCQLQHVKYRAQLRFKTGLVRDALKKIAGIGVPVAACERSEKEYGYRNKLQLPVGRRDGRNVIGFFAERSHRIVPIDGCPLHPEWADKLIAAVYNFMEKCGLDGYDEETGEGQIRHIVVRELRGKFLVTYLRSVAPEQLHPARRGLVYAREHVKQRRLARTRLADHRDELSLAHLEIYALQHFARRGGIVVSLPKPLGFQNDVAHFPTSLIVYHIPRAYSIGGAPSAPN